VKKENWQEGETARCVKQKQNRMKMDSKEDYKERQEKCRIGETERQRDRMKNYHFKILND